MKTALAETLRPGLRAALLLGSFALLGSALVSFTHRITEPVIRHNERQMLLTLLEGLLPRDRHDDAIIGDTLRIHDPTLLGTSESITVYRAYHDGEPLAVFATPVAPDGYGGSIRLLVATHADGTLAGVRVLGHRETPGLGDAIEATRSDWIHGFRNRALGDPPLANWAVRRDGGAFDQLTGATISARAVVRAVRDWLRYFAAHRRQLLARRETTS